MGIRIWLDDKRLMPEGFDLHILTSNSAINRIHSGNVSFISFDHDLGVGGSGYDVACEIERLAYHNVIPAVGWDVHSDNPCGRMNITRAMQKAEEYWREHGRIAS